MKQFYYYFQMSALLACLAITPAKANEINIYEEQFFPKTAEDFIKALKPISQNRGISIEYQEAEIDNTQPIIKSPNKPSVNLRIHFAFNSARLDEKSKFLLYELSKALTSEDLSSYKFSIVGHTDVVGPNQYNQSLSEKRAIAVRSYLTSMLGIQKQRLETEGHGEENLLDPYNPKSYVNRRVEITNLGLIKNTINSQ